MSEIKPPSPLMTLLEGRAVAEAGATMMSLPLLRATAIRGQGEPVLTLPGFMASDASTALLRRFLGQIGYDAQPWNLGRNRRPLFQYLPVLIERTAALAQESGHKVRLVGWSRGGMIARELARERPDLIDRVITMGTPVTGGLGATTIARWIRRELGVTVAQMAALQRERNVTPIRVPVRAIYSKSDGVVAWRACLDDHTPDFNALEVHCSHVGMGASVQVLRLLPRLLREEAREAS